MEEAYRREGGEKNSSTVNAFKLPNEPRVITTHVLWFLVQAQLDELLELFTEVSRELRGVVLGYEEEDPHWVHVRVGRLSFR